MAYASDSAATNDQDLIVECQERYKLAMDSESANRTEALTDINFANGDQWPVDIRRDRDTDGRPCLTINITDAMVRRVTNALRENRPRIKFHPVGDGADVQAAKVRNGLMRHIESASSADYAYDCAVESAVRGGWGYIRVGSRYVDERSFDQDLTIDPIRNPFTVYFDPTSSMPDGSDASWAIVSDMMRRDEYRVRYGDVDPLGWQYMGSGDSVADWATKEQIRVAEYWRVHRKMDTLHMLSDGSTKFTDELPEEDTLEAAGIEIVRTRRVMRKFVEWYLLSATAVLDRREWPGKYIPIVPVYGREVDLNGRIVRKGMIRDLRDPARMYNYGQTTMTEVAALQPKAPWLIAEGQMEGHEAAWRDANRKPIVALPYKPVTGPNGEMMPPPQRQSAMAPAEGLMQWIQGSQSDFMAVAGMPHEPGQDSPGEVVSGLAIKRRQGLSDISHFDFADNLTRSLKHIGSIVSDLIPHFYDTQRIQRIIGDDGTPDTTTINEKVRDPLTQAVVRIKNDLTGGLYDTVVDTGPGYQTKREEAAEAMLELLATPLGEMTAKVAGDVVVRSLDFPDADTIADRMAAMIPGAQIDKDSDIPPKAQMMIKGLQQQLQQMQQSHMALELELKTKSGLEQMRQQGETQRLQMKEQAETQRTQMELGVRREDVQTKAHTSMFDTHVKSITAHDVAEIHAATQLLNTHAEAEHNRRAAKELEKSAEKAERRSE